MQGTEYRSNPRAGCSKQTELVRGLPGPVGLSRGPCSFQEYVELRRVGANKECGLLVSCNGPGGGRY
jgi:hypothetical protein